MIIHKTADNDCTMVKQSINSDSTLIKAQWSLVIMMVGLHFLNKQCVAQMDCGRVFIDLCFNLEEITFNLTFTMFTRHFNASRMIPVKFTRIKKKINNLTGSRMWPCIAIRPSLSLMYWFPNLVAEIYST